MRAASTRPGNPDPEASRAERLILAAHSAEAEFLPSTDLLSSKTIEAGVVALPEPDWWRPPGSGRAFSDRSTSPTSATIDSMTPPTSHPFDFVVAQAGLDLDENGIDPIIRDYVQALGALGGVPRTAEAVADGARPVAVFVATGGTERAILDGWAAQQQTAPGEPLLLIAHPGNNSLPAALEVLARLQQDGRPGRIFYLRGPDDAAGLAEIAAAVEDLDAHRALQGARIGLVGPPSDWLVASSPEAAIVREVWGPTVVPVEMKDLTGRLEAISAAEVEALVSDLAAGAAEVREPTASELEAVARVYFSLKRLVKDRELDAVTVRCFDLVLEHRTTGCLALAELTDDGVIAGCEGDLVSTVGLLWAKELLGVPPWMANPAQIDCAHNSLWLAHCTVPRSLVSSYRLRSHFESGLGVGIQGMLSPGPVTLLRIGGRGMDHVWLAEGEILRSGDADNLCRTQAQIRLTAGGCVTDLLRTPLGNHLVLVPGHHLERLSGWCRDFLSSPAGRHPG